MAEVAQTRVPELEPDTLFPSCVPSLEDSLGTYPYPRTIMYNPSKADAILPESSLPFARLSFCMSENVLFILHSRCLRIFWNSPDKAPTRDVLYETPPAKDSTEWLIPVMDFARMNVKCFAPSRSVTTVCSLSEPQAFHHLPSGLLPWMSIQLPGKYRQKVGFNGI